MAAPKAVAKRGALSLATAAPYTAEALVVLEMGSATE
jgi:hypothetical protein